MAEQMNLQSLNSLLRTMKSGKVEVHFVDGIITKVNVQRARQPKPIARFYK
jgi:hypothetical protein